MRNWENYLTKGGRIKDSTGLKKIWGMNDSIYRELITWAQMPAPVKQAGPTKIDINQSDSSSLVKLLQGKKSLSGRIIRYRERLGGFVKKEQLKEVYGISEQLYQTLAPGVFINTGFKPKRINLLDADFKTLISHPYIDYNLAKLLINFRKHCEPECTLERLNQLLLIDSVEIQKLIPYIKVKKE